MLQETITKGHWRTHSGQALVLCKHLRAREELYQKIPIFMAKGFWHVTMPISQDDVTTQI